MKNKKKMLVTINKEDTRSILKTITGFAVSRFQKSITSKLTTLTENIEDGNKKNKKSKRTRRINFEYRDRRRSA